jgi:hypothetical protein
MKIFQNRAFKTSSVLLAVAFSASTTFAEDFTKGSKAKDFGLNEAVQSTFSAKVVDLLCEVAGDCAANCGEGNRQLGLVRDADNKLIAVLKNGQFSFNGAAEDLLPYCNKKVEVDGIMVGDPEEHNTQFYMVQFIKAEGAAEFNKANKWTKAWAARNPDAKGKGPWFRRDPRVIKQIEANGYFGLGKDADIAYAKENQ